jgi:phage gp36-like protein
VSAPVPITLLASEARDASGAGASVDLGARTTVALELAVTEVSGTTPTLTVTVQHSADGVLWSTLGAFEAVSITGATALRLPGCKRYVRAAWVLGGTTPSFTFALAGVSLQPFATPAKMKALAGAGAWCAGIPDADCDEQLVTASSLAEDYLQSFYDLPLVSWPPTLEQAVCHIAAYHLTAHEGFDSANAGSTPRKLYEDALAWLERVSKVGAAGIVDSSEDEDDGGPAIYTNSPRGWR